MIDIDSNGGGTNGGNDFDGYASGDVFIWHTAETERLKTGENEHELLIKFILMKMNKVEKIRWKINEKLLEIQLNICFNPRK